MAETISKLIIEIDGKEYEFEGSGTPGPNTVGTDQIIDGAVEMEDLNESVQEKIQKTYNESEESLSMEYDEEQS